MVKTNEEFHPDTLELTYGAITIVIGLGIEDTDEEDVPPFYVSLNVHGNMIIHNAMLDFGSSHNPMPRVVVRNHETLQIFILF